MTITPLIVVADSIAGLKNNGIVPAIAKTNIETLPTFKVAPLFKSTAMSFDAEEKEESSVDAAETIMIKLINKSMIGPKSSPNFDNSLDGAPLSFPNTPTRLKRKITPCIIYWPQ